MALPFTAAKSNFSLNSHPKIFFEAFLPLRPGDLAPLLKNYFLLSVFNCFDS
jgi:hypothetical protein